MDERNNGRGAELYAVYFPAPRQAYGTMSVALFANACTDIPCPLLQCGARGVLRLTRKGGLASTRGGRIAPAFTCALARRTALGPVIVFSTVCGSVLVACLSSG